MSDRVILHTEGEPPREATITKIGKVPRDVERFMRVYGRDFMDAFASLERARECLDLGAVAQASTYARHAAMRLRDAKRKNDQGRSHDAIVDEILTVFNEKPTFNFQDHIVFPEATIIEIQQRLECDREHAIGLLHRHFTASNPELSAAERIELDRKGYGELPRGE